jgi:hypothetical protein
MFVYLSLHASRSKAATALAAFNRIFQKSSSFFHGSFSRALTLTFPRQTSLQCIYSNHHFTQIPETTVNCHIVSRQTTITPTKTHANPTHNPAQ